MDPRRGSEVHLLRKRRDMTVEAANSAQLKEFIRSMRESDGYHPREADSNLNDSNRTLIEAMAAENGVAWIGKINLYKEDEGKDPLWQWDGSLVYNFGASFVVPHDDERLRQLIIDRDRSKYTGTAADSVLVEAIMDRIAELGGFNLIWS